MCWLWPVLLIGVLYGLVTFVEIIQRFTAGLPIDKRLLYSAVGTGVIFGVAVSMIAAQTGIIIKHWIDARQGFRTDRLMLKYHDELREKETSNQAMHQRQ